MKNRLFTGFVAVAAALSMTLNVMAAGSIVGAIDTPQVSVGEGSVTLEKVESDTYEEKLQEVVEKVNAAPQDATVKDAFGEKLPQTIDLYDKEGLEKKNIDLSEYRFLSPVMDLQLSGVTPTAANPVKVTFVANNMTDNLIVDVLHYCGEHGWEVLEGEKLSANQVAAYFHSASPVALIYKEKPVSGGAGSDSGAAPVSPQTGEASTAVLAGAVVLFAAAGVYALSKSKKAAR